MIDRGMCVCVCVCVCVSGLRGEIHEARTGRERRMLIASFRDRTSSLTTIDGQFGDRLLEIRINHARGSSVQAFPSISMTRVSNDNSWLDLTGESRVGALRHLAWRNNGIAIETIVARDVRDRRASQL